MVGPVSMRLSCPCVTPIQRATMSCGSGWRPWNGWQRYALITLPIWRLANAALIAWLSQNSAGTSGGAANRSRLPTLHGAQ
jgi:hypothetical protein